MIKTLFRYILRKKNIFINQPTEQRFYNLNFSKSNEKISKKKILLTLIQTGQNVLRLVLRLNPKP
jgi:hypothetical protein